MLNHILRMVTDLRGNEPLYFDTPVTIKSAHDETWIWGVCVSPQGEVLAMDAEQEWHQLEEKPSDAMVMEGVFQKVRHLYDNTSRKKEEVFA